MKWGIILLSIIFAFSLLACNRTSNDSSAKAIVKIDDTIYTSEDLWDYANIVLWEMDPRGLSNEEVKEKILQDFIEHKLLLEEADKRGIVEYHQKQPNQLYAQLTSEEGAKELKAVTGQYDIEADKVAKLAEERLIIDELNQLVVTNMSYITEAELRRFYDSKNINRNQKGVAHVLHIFTTDNAMAEAAAKELASGIIFSEVARKYSEGPETNNGGDLGFINEADFPEFFNAAFKLKAGDVSDIIRSDYGFHIFKVVEYANAERTSYENMKQGLYAELYTQKRQAMIREFVNALQDNADIQRLNSFTLDELFPNKIQR